MSSLFRKTINCTPNVAVNESRYGHDTGMVLIAMESAQELYDIFCEGTLAAEEAELDAVSEGVVLEGSQFEVVQENAIKSAYSKIKAFLEKLWVKVKAFFKQVRMHLDKIFMSGRDFVVKYEKEIKEAAKNAKDFEYKMYKYNNSLIDDKADAQLMGDEFIEQVSGATKSLVSTLLGDAADLEKGEGIPETVDGMKETIDEFKKAQETIVKEARKEMCGTTDEDEVAAGLFKLFRNGATDESDKEDQKWDSEIVNILKNGKTVAKLDNMSNKMDTAFRKAIRVVEDTEKQADGLSGAAQKAGGYLAEALRELSSTVSKLQTLTNQYVAAWKTAVTEREAAYKNCTMALLRHKNK